MEEIKFSDLYSEPSKNGLSIKFIDDPNGYKIVNMKELFGSPVLTDEIEMRKVLLNSNELKRFALKKGDLLFGRRSLVYEGAGKSTLFKGQDENVIFESSIIRVRINIARAIPEFLLYLFQSSYGKSKISSIIGGAAVFGIRGSDLANLKFYIPKISVQSKIVSILSSYDELIENNNKRIKLLEEMAEEIYKEWFVRFRFPGYEKAKFINGLPEGWEKKPINSFVEIISGYAFKTEVFDSEGIYKLVTIKNVQDGYFVTETTDYIHELPKNLKDDCKLKDKDIILSLTGNIGRVCLVYGDNYVLNQRVAKLKPKADNLFEYVYLMFMSKFLRATLENLSNGAAQQNLSPVEMGKLKYLLPSNDILTKFSRDFNTIQKESGSSTNSGFTITKID